LTSFFTFTSAGFVSTGFTSVMVGISALPGLAASQLGAAPTGGSGFAAPQHGGDVARAELKVQANFALQQDYRRQSRLTKQ
jgi:hypothetical protein